jgi:ATP-dependent protease Clp ATPase subunit
MNLMRMPWYDLKEPKNSLIKQYQKLFDMENVAPCVLQMAL